MPRWLTKGGYPVPFLIHFAIHCFWTYSFATMKKLGFAVLFMGLLTLRAFAAADSWLPVEKDVATAIASPKITVVHFWAPWCPNCKAELVNDGWKTFIAAHPDVNFVFVTIWHAGDDGKAKLTGYGLGDQSNLTVLLHPNSVRKGDGRMASFMDLPVTCIPTTLIFLD